LITILHEAYNLGLKSESFDQSISWFRLTNLADTYHWAAGVTQEKMYNADRKARLRVLAKTMEKARGLIDRAMQDDVGDELFSAWCEEADTPLASVVRNDDGTLTMVRTAEETFNNATRSVAALETAAVRASREAHGERVGAGRPRGTSALPHGYVITLADIYQESTGRKPETGGGPFARFVLGFLAATGRDLSERHVLEIIEDALKPNP
jgi:hypothetical protein